MFVAAYLSMDFTKGLTTHEYNAAVYINSYLLIISYMDHEVINACSMC